MMSIESAVLNFAVHLTLAMLILAAALASIRLFRGPDPADRIIALDLISVLLVSFLAALSIYAGETSFLDVAIAYALVAFLGTVALARFRLRTGAKPGRGPTGDEKS